MESDYLLAVTFPSEKVAALRANSDKDVDADAIFHTVLDVAGLHTDALISEKTLAGVEY